jgi:hypothetical protein
MSGKIAEAEHNVEYHAAVRKDRYVNWVNTIRLLR